MSDTLIEYTKLGEHEAVGVLLRAASIGVDEEAEARFLNEAELCCDHVMGCKSTFTQESARSPPSPTPLTR